VAQVNMHEAKTNLSLLVKRMLEGEEIVIARAGTPVARLVPWTPPPRARRSLGRDEGLVSIADDFDAPLPEEIRREIEG
jgi:prevent-host-death family protein